MRGQSANPQPAAPLAFGAHDFQHRDLAGEIAERDGIASHRRRPRLFANSKLAMMAVIAVASNTIEDGSGTGWKAFAATSRVILSPVASP
jgi:hypothetical protein